MENKAVMPNGKPVAKKEVISTTDLVPIIKTNEQATAALMIMKQQFVDFAKKQQGKDLSQKELECGVSLIGDLVQRCREEGRDTSKLNLNSFISDVKDTAKLGLSTKSKEVYFDIRNNGKTGQVDVKIKRQYQGEKSILTNFCEKKIVRFKDGVVLNEDNFEYHEDFESGLTVITKHEKIATTRNDLKNITFAYAIAYVQEDGKLVPYVCLIDNERIMRGYKAATTKIIWDTDTAAMATKTAYICLKQMLDPFMQKDIEIVGAIARTADDMDWYNDIEQPTYNIDDEDVIEATEVKTVVGEIVEKQEPQLDDLPDFLQDKPTKLACSECGTKITEIVFNFSNSKYGRPLCFDCQNKNKK